MEPTGATPTSFDALSLAGFDKIPKQLQAWGLMWLHKFVLYGGARGPGKSRWLRWSLLMFLIYWGKFRGIKGVRVGLFCETYPTLQDRQISKIKVEFPLWMGELKSTLTEGLGFFLNEKMGGGAILLRNLDEPDKYQSAEFAAIGVDELTKNSFRTFEILRGSLRWAGIDHNPFLGASNPGSIGHMWVKALWVDRDFTLYPDLKGREGEFVFVRALPRDNPFLSKEYWIELNSLTAQLRKAWVDGNWDAFEGMAFMEWNPLAHVVEPFTIPAHWPRWRATDWGYTRPWCTLWATRNPDSGRIYIYREAYAVGLTDRAQARTIKSHSAGEEIVVHFADPSMWAKKNVKDVVTSTADEYSAEGVVLTQADNDRIAGKRKVHRAMADLPDGKPGLMIFRGCVNLIRTLPALPLDPVKVEDVDTKGEDHAYDTLRYLLTDLRDRQPERSDQETKAWLRQMEALARVT